MLMPAYNLLGYSLNEVKYINSHKDNTYIGNYSIEKVNN